MEDGKKPKAHRPSRSIVKTNKKRLKKHGKITKRHNSKAFTFSGGTVSVQRKVQRSLDIQAFRYDRQIIDKTPSIPPPYVVVVQGPKNCGKTTLIRSLVKHYTKHTLTEVKGPITVVTGKNRRLTFIECPNDVQRMLDLAKVADLVLLMIDASYGFEMETFEFLSILKVHGFPRILGILTYLDKFKENKMLRKVKQRFKKRFWAEIYEGAKLFYLSGLHYRRYRQREILNLARYLAVQKFGVLSYQSTHAYFVALRMEDVEIQPDNYSDTPVITASLYGYLKGARMKLNQSIHIPGAGDFQVESIVEYTDPCPPPQRTLTKKGVERTENQSAGSHTMRSLKDHQRHIYAPLCDVGNVRFDSDAVYIHLPSTMEGFTKPDLLLNDQNKKSDEESIADDESSVFASESEKSLSEDEVDDNDEGSEDDNEGSEDDNDEGSEDDNEENEGDNVGGGPNGTHTLEKRHSESGRTEAVKMVRALQSADSQIEKKLSYQRLTLLSKSKGVLIPETSPEKKNEGADAEPKSAGEYPESSNLKKLGNETPESQIVSLQDQIYVKCTIPEAFDTLDQANGKLSLFEENAADFVNLEDNSGPIEMGKCASKKFGLWGQATFLERDRMDISKLSANDLFSKMLQTSFKSLPDLESFWTDAFKDKLKGKKFMTGGWSYEDDAIDTKGNELSEEKTTDTNVSATTPLLENQSIKQSLESLNEVHAMSSVEMGIAIGKYIRITIKGLPKDWYMHHKNQTTPVIVGALLPGEMQFGLLQLRMQKHRWAPKILKTKDPLLFSVGWRRFQSLPVFFTEDRNSKRQRMLKYTPEHMHCHVSLYGPITSRLTGILAIQTVENVSGFRVSATGVVLESSATSHIVKKLKLVGEPKKIYKHTAFIKGMFNSDLEVSKFIGAKLQTVSGIRGQVKRAYGVHGLCRATFEDKILLSDIVFCKTWVAVDTPKFYNPLLDIPEWRAMKTLSTLRNELSIPIPYKADADYGAKPERSIKRFNPVKVPKSILKRLPFSSKPKMLMGKKKKADDVTKATSIEMNAYEKKIASLFQRMQTLRNERLNIRKEKQTKYIESKKLKEDREAISREAKRKELRKERYVKSGKREASMRKKLRLSD